MKNEELLYDTIIALDKYKELLGWQVKLDPRQSRLNFFDIRKSNEDYIKAELEWYNSMDLDVSKLETKTSIWKEVKGYDNTVNSNYGYLIYSEDNHSQWLNCIKELVKNKESRRAIMIYLSPDMWIKHQENGKNDFVCTSNTHLFIRDNRLIYIVNQRSCDFVYGFFNDFAWHCYVYEQTYKALKEFFYNLEYGIMIYNADTLHIYPRHYDLINNITNKINSLKETSNDTHIQMG